MRKFSFSLLFICFFLSLNALARQRLTVEQSIQLALGQSPLMLKVRADIKAAEGAAGQAVAGFLPHLSLEGSVGKYYAEPQTMQIDLTGTGSPAAVSFGTDEQADTSNYSASLTQSIFTGGKLMSSLSIASQGLAMAKEELRRISQEVRFNVINAYYSVTKARKLVELGQQSVNMARNHLDRVKALLKHGMSTKADVLRVEVQVARAQIGLTRAKQALEISKNNFNNALGRDLDAGVELVESQYQAKPPAIYNYKELLKIAYSDRPDWQQYVLMKQISESEVGLAYSGLWPMISLVGRYEVGSTKYSSYQSDIKNWTAVFSGSWNIFDGTATWNKIKEARAKLAAQKADEATVKRGIALEVKDANFALKSAADNLSGTRKAQELANENYKIAEQRYNFGLGTNLQVLDAQVALTQARIDHLQAQHDLQIAKARINKVIGREIY